MASAKTRPYSGMMSEFGDLGSESRPGTGNMS